MSALQHGWALWLIRSLLDIEISQHDRWAWKTSYTRQSEKKFFWFGSDFGPNIYISNQLSNFSKNWGMLRDKTKFQ